MVNADHLPEPQRAAATTVAVGKRVQGLVRDVRAIGEAVAVGQATRHAATRMLDSSTGTSGPPGGTRWRPTRTLRPGLSRSRASGLICETKETRARIGQEHVCEILRVAAVVRPVGAVKPPRETRGRLDVVDVPVEEDAEGLVGWSWRRWKA